MHKSRSPALLGVALLVLAACTAGPPPASSSPGASAAASAAASAGGGSSENVLIGIIVGLSGANSVIAPSVVQAAQLAADELNNDGGILGKTVTVQVFDDGSGPDGAIPAFNSAIYDAKVNVIVAMETSSARNAGAPVANKANMPFIYTSPYEGGSCMTNLFIDTQVPVQQTKPGLEYLQQQLNAETWFLVGSDYAYGRGALEYAKQTVEDLGGTIVGEEYNPVDAADWSPILSKVRNANPDGVITATAGGAPNVSFLKQYKAAGLTQPIMSLSLDEGTAQSIGKDAEGVYLSSDYFTSLPNQQNTDFLAAMEQKFGAEMETPNYLSVPTYDGMHLYALAATKAGSVDVNAILSALPSVSFTGPRGPVQMDKQHHTSLEIHIGQVQADGSVEIVNDVGLIDPGDQCPELK